MGNFKPYDRQKAVFYAHRWAFGRNPAFYNYDGIGGDCTNFASQCLLAGGGVMDYTPDFGWYYINANRKSPAWTGVEYLFDFLLRPYVSVGPKAAVCTLADLRAGDIVQLSFDGSAFTHTPVVVSALPPYEPENILLAAHSEDADRRPLSTYAHKKLRPLHIEGVITGMA